MGYFECWDQVKKIVLGSTDIVQQLIFSMFPSILGSFLTFGALMGYFWDWGGG